MKKNMLTGLPGMIAPLLFVSVFTLFGFFKPGYDAFKMHVSALSIGPLGWIQIVNFMLFGSLLFIFSLSLLRQFRAEKRSKSGPVILLISSICFFFSGPFVMDPMGTPQEAMTIHGLIHGIAGGIVFILMPVTCFVFFAQYKNDPALVRFKRWSFVLGIITLAGLIAFTVITKSAYLNTLFYNWQGLFQRSVLIPYLLWLFGAGLHFRKQV